MYERSIQTLIAILDGHTYAALSQREGVKQSALERRVKCFDARLRSTIGVQGLPSDRPIRVHEMRRHKPAYLAALEQFTPNPKRRPVGRALDSAQFQRLLYVARHWSKCPERDVALVHTLFATALRPLEIALLQVRDYLHADGSVRQQSLLRQEAAFNECARALFFVSDDCNRALDAYLTYRRREGYGALKPNAYRGLDPNSALFLTVRGESLLIIKKVRAGRVHRQCNALRETYTKLFRRAGVVGATAMSARRTAAQRLFEKGYAADTIAKILGLQRRAVRALVSLRAPGLLQAAKDIALPQR